MTLIFGAQHTRPVIERYKERAVKTLLVVLSIVAPFAAAGPARGAGDPAGVAMEIRAQGRAALLVIHTSQRVRVAPDHRRALAAAVDGFEARSRVAGHGGPTVARALAGVRHELLERFRAMPPRGEFVTWRYGRAVTGGRREAIRHDRRRGWAAHTAITPR